MPFVSLPGICARRSRARLLACLSAAFLLIVFLAPASASGIASQPSKSRPNIGAIGAAVIRSETPEDKIARDEVARFRVDTRWRMEGGNFYGLLVIIGIPGLLLLGALVHFWQ